VGARYGALEAGGTKFVAAVGGDPIRPEDVRRIPTSNNPLETIREVAAYFASRGPLAALGVAAFGPLNLATGAIGNTPKLAWRDFPLKDSLEWALGVPVGLDTDVNGAALGEVRYGAGRGLDSFVYVTVGTGIGGGAVVGGRTLHGRLHPEMGHLLVRGHAEEPVGFRGVCPFHGGCLEGMASGPAIQQRWGRPAEELPGDHPAWRFESYYLAQLCVALACVLSPRAIALGGGVMEKEFLLPMIRLELENMLAGYLDAPAVVAPELPLPGLTGAFVLAQQAAEVNAKC
jgi:fructokinase